MDRFLVNMAIVRVNWDRNRSDILDNYIPLVHEALNKLNDATFSIDDFKEKFMEIAEFSIPTGAIISLLNRSMKKYGMLEKERTGIYRIIKEKLKSSGISEIRDSEQRKYNKLIKTFSKYCKDTFNFAIVESEAAEYFFEILYEIAPTLFLNLANVDNLTISQSDKKKYHIAKFINYSNNYDQESFEAILSFVRGSMLTETFYYSQNYNDITDKPLKKVTVYFDTQFLIRILGYSDKSQCIPCLELLDMLNDMKVRMKCFRNTFNEIHGIFFAALSQINQFGRLINCKPGDAFDYINRHNMTSSDLTILLETLEEKLNKKGVYVTEKPEIIEAYSINEANLSEELHEHFDRQSEKARNHDIDCLQAIFQIREGKKKSYLENCKAIFITTNANLARLSTIFFNNQYGHSNAPVCMADHVFTSLVWMKAVKKAPNLPKDRLVANCYSALMPSDSLWTQYINEANRLKEQGAIDENDYHVLVHTITARDQLMEHAFSADDNIFGSVEEILEKAKMAHTEEISKELTELKQKSNNQTTRLNNLIVKIESIVCNLSLFLFLSIWILTLTYSLFFTSPDEISDLKKVSTKSIIFILLVIVTILNLVFGIKLLDSCRYLSDKIALTTSKRLREILIDT
ncbi:MAG: hypothetical protein D3906_01765 [Candidatus Electrothrix sp. AUS1_2]|nr:hypothetical protein [Candidatus Electrothrix sp. AUS1_2]